MKVFYILVVLAVCFFSSCKEEERGQFPIDEVAPGPVRSAVVENVAGGAIITYTIPTDEDLLYVKAIYTLDNGKVMEQKASAYANTLKIEGIGKSRVIDITLIAGDRSKNESQPVVVQAHPMDAPIYSIINTLNVNNDFGGIRLNWKNPEMADVVVCVITPDDSGEFVTAGNFYSNSKDGKGTIRGYESVERLFGVYLRDRWGNLTDTITGKYVPLFEEEVKDRIARWNPPGIPYTAYGSYHIENFWDGNPLSFHIQITTGFPWSFTFDLGEKVKLSRIKQWQRQGATLIYTSQNVNKFEVWGSLTPNVTDDFSGWVKIGDFVATKPSGGLPGINTAEDVDFAAGGEDFIVDPSAPPIRYIRYVVKDTWSGSTTFAFGDVKFFGSKQ